MAFRLTTIFWAIALFAAAMVAFGAMGIFPAGLVVAGWFWVLQRRQSALGAGGVPFAISMACFIAILLMPMVQSPRASSRTSQCGNNLKQIALAMLLYCDQHKVFPPPFVTDASGKPMHSWRVLILPYLEREDLYSRYNFSEPWDSPNNRKLAASMPDVLGCPAQAGSPAGETHYFAVVDPQTASPPGGGRTLRNITDGTSRTLMLLEVPGKSVNWMEPSDLTFDEAVQELTSKPRTRHADSSHGLFTLRGPVRNVAICDGSVRRFPQILDAEYATALLTAAGGEARFPTVDSSLDGDSPLFNDPQFLWGKVYALVAFVLLSLVPVTRFRCHNAAIKADAAKEGANDADG